MDPSSPSSLMPLVTVLQLQALAGWLHEGSSGCRNLVLAFLRTPGRTSDDLRPSRIGQLAETKDVAVFGIVDRTVKL